MFIFPLKINLRSCPCLSLTFVSRRSPIRPPLPQSQLCESDNEDDENTEEEEQEDVEDYKKGITLIKQRQIQINF